MGARRRRSDRAGRPAMYSPGRPSVARREDRQRFWAAIARGVSSEDAAGEAGVSAGGWRPVVSRGWRDAYCHSGPAVGALPVLRRAGGDRDPACPRVWRAGDRAARSAVHRRRSRASCAAMPPRAAALWSIAPRPRSGTPIGVPGVRRPPSSPPTSSCASYVQDRLAGAVRAAGRERGRGPRGPLDRPASRPPHRTAAGRRRGARSRSPRRLRVDFPDDASMRISHEAIYQALYVQGRGALRRELTACLRTGRALRVPRARSRASRQGLRDRGDPDQRAPGRGRGPGGARALGGRSHPRPGQLRDRHARRAQHPVHHAAAPAADGRPRRSRESRTAPRSPATAPRPSATRSPQPSRPCPSSCADRSPGTRARRWHNTRSCASTPASSVYFCDPHSPWQRGTNENTNGLLRQYFPKGTDLSRHSPTTSPPSPPRSTAAPARHSAGRPRPRRSTSIYNHVNKPALRRPIDSALYANFDEDKATKSMSSFASSKTGTSSRSPRAR